MSSNLKIILHKAYPSGYRVWSGITVGPNAPSTRYATEAEVRAGLAELPAALVSVLAARGHEIHVFRNPLVGGSPHVYDIGSGRGCLGEGPPADWSGYQWQEFWAGITVHEIGHVVEFGWLKDDLATRYWALRLPHPAVPHADWFAEDLRQVFGGALATAARHKCALADWDAEVRAKARAVVMDVVGKVVLEGEGGMTGTVKGLKLLRPVDEKHPVTARFGQTGPHWTPYHRGTDFGCPSGTAVKAVMSGVVDRVSEETGYGKYVKLHHPQVRWVDETGREHSGLFSLYAHLNAAAKDLRVGVRVVQGETVAYSGATGTKDPHLHFELRGPHGTIKEAFNAEPYFVKPTYPDVLPERWSFEAVEQCAQKGYLVGYPDGTFNPTRPVTREELAVFALRLKGE